MRRTTTLTALAALAVAPLGLAAAPALAAETCDGKVATIVVLLEPGTFSSAPVVGTPGDDVIVGTEQNDTIDGAGGNDTICGLAGADTLVGGDGDDRLFGGADAEYFSDDGYFGDLLVPGAGDDHVDLGTGDGGHLVLGVDPSRSTRCPTPMRPPAYASTSRQAPRPGTARTPS